MSIKALAYKEDASLLDEIKAVIRQVRELAFGAKTEEERNEVLNYAITLSLAATCCKKRDDIRRFEEMISQQVTTSRKIDTPGLFDAHVRPSLEDVLEGFRVSISNIRVRAEKSIRPGKYFLKFRHANHLHEFVGYLDGEKQKWTCDQRPIAVKARGNVWLRLEPYPGKDRNDYHDFAVPSFSHPVELLFEEEPIFLLGHVAVQVTTSWSFEAVIDPVDGAFKS